ncbi:MAG: MerC domain-containing protein [Halieaceae bacterium]|nr:MerC domain-containing protein [Halieaceae bacterium]
MKVEAPSQQVQTRADIVAIGLSVGCLLHCLALPVALALLPTLSIDWLTDESFHRWLLVAILPTSVLALLMGCWKHRQVSVIALGFSGLLLLIWAAFFGHHVVGELGEKAVTTVGAVVIAVSHIMNQRFCRQSACEC